MRIFLTIHPSSNLSVPGSMTWYINLYKPLIDIGCDVILIRMDEVARRCNVKFRSKKFREQFSEVLLDAFIKHHSQKPFDLFLSYLTDLDVHGRVIERIKQSGVPTANFSCNNTHQFSLIKEISPLYDFNLHAEKDADVHFKEIGANPVWFPMAANPDHYYPRKLSYKYDVSFVGSAYARRANYVDHLVCNHVEINCFGPNWLINKPYDRLKKIKKEAERLKWVAESAFLLSADRRYSITSKVNNYDLLSRLREKNRGRLHYPPDDDAILNIISESKINLGFLEVFISGPGSEVKSHLHLREFEIPMCGGFYMTNFNSELSEFYEPGKEIIMFNNEHDLLEKVRYYLLHENEREKIREAAHLRALKCHTYQKRFRDLFSRIL